MAIPTSSEPGIRREVGGIALLFTALGSIIGSGWLFGAWRAAQLAGPGAVYAWLLGAVIILFVALTFAELGAMFPESGGSVRCGLGKLDLDRLRDSRRGGGLGAIHEFLVLGLGAGLVPSCRARRR